MCKDAKVISVLASINVDLVVEVEHFPKPGETIKSDGIEKHFGGKGANQAIAARRVGAKVNILGKVGQDELGKEYISHFNENDISTNNILCSDNKSTGQAIINIDKNGENNIIVVSGANSGLSNEDVDVFCEKLEETDVAISQFEVPLNVTEKFLKLAKEKKCITVLNPAPAQKIPESLNSYVDISIPNENELKMITDHEVDTMEQIEQAARDIIQNGIPYIIVTLGENGTLIVSDTESLHIPAKRVHAIDTTAAGDTFIGAFSYKMAEAKEINMYTLKESAEFATKASALTVQKKGAQASIPYMKDIVEL